MPKGKIKNSRYFSLVTYASREQIESVLLLKDKQIRSFAFICHDKDVEEDTGEVKQPHFHIVLALWQARSDEDIKKWFSGLTDEKSMLINTFAKICDKAEVKNYYKYLTHENAPTKYQYKKEEVQEYNSLIFASSEVIEDDTMMLALDDLLNGVSLQTVYRRYGRDFIIHYNSIRKLYIDILDGGIYNETNKE